MDIELVLRVAACGTFVGHGWIAAWKLEFGGWSKFMEAAGFRTSEAHVVMPLIGWMDIILGVVTLLHPLQLTTAWMVVWAFATAAVRPFSAGWRRTLRPMSDNALWGFVERAANWACPLALLQLQLQPGYAPRSLGVVGFGFEPARHLAGLEPYLGGFQWPQLQQFMTACLSVLCLTIVALRSRGAPP